MNSRRLLSSSLTVVRHSKPHCSNVFVVSNLSFTKCALHILTLKNLLIAFLLTFLLVSIGFSPGPSYTAVWHIYVKSVNESISVVSGQSFRHFENQENLTTDNRTADNKSPVAFHQDEIKPDAFENETNAIKDSIRRAFLKVSKPIDYCPLNFNRFIQGSLNVTEILEKTGLNGLVQFHEKSNRL